MVMVEAVRMLKGALSHLLQGEVVLSPEAVLHQWMVVGLTLVVHLLA
jgi:hypothetical protein